MSRRRGVAALIANRLSNLDYVLRAATGLPVSIAEDPLTCVALGTGRCLEEMKTLKSVLFSMY